MAYNVTNKSADYTATDTSKVVIDGLGTIFVVLVGFASLVGFVLLYKWFKKNK